MLRLAIMLAALAAPGVSSATLLTMSFDGFVGPVHTENGITATGDPGFGNTGFGDFAFIERSPLIGGATSFVDFTTGSLFAPVTFDVRPIKSNYCSTLTPANQFDVCGENVPDDDPIPYIWASGFLGDTLLGSIGFYRPSSQDWETIDLSALGTIDRLRLEVKAYFDLGLPGACNGGQGCGKFDADNVTIQVPEPGTLLLLSGALAGLAFTRRKLAR